MKRSIPSFMVINGRPPASTGIAFVQAKSYGSTSGLVNHSITLDTTPVQGNTLILGIFSDNTVASISGSGWALAVQSLDNGAAYIYYKVAGASEPTTITVTLSSALADSCAIGCVEYSGLIGTLDKTANAIGQNGANTPINTGTTATTTAANELIVGVAGMWGSTGTSGQVVNSWDNSFVSKCAGSGVDASHPFSGLDMATKIVSATGAFTGNATTNLSLSANDSGAIATFK